MSKLSMAKEIRTLRKQNEELQNKVTKLEARQILDYQGVRELNNANHNLATKLMTAKNNERMWILNEITNMRGEAEFDDADYDMHTLDVLYESVIAHYNEEK